MRLADLCVFLAMSGLPIRRQGVIATYYLNDGEDIFRTSHWQVADRADQDTDRYPVQSLFDELRHRDALVVPHIGGRPASLAFHDPDLEPVIEIYSAWGQFEWLLREAIERGYKVGFSLAAMTIRGVPALATQVRLPLAYMAD